MSNIKIDKDIPIPEMRSKWRRIFNEMKIGDSIVLDEPNKHSCLSSAYRYKVIVISKKLGENEYRVWKKGEVE